MRFDLGGKSIYGWRSETRADETYMHESRTQSVGDETYMYESYANHVRITSESRTNHVRR